MVTTRDHSKTNPQSIGKKRSLPSWAKFSEPPPSQQQNDNNKKNDSSSDNNDGGGCSLMSLQEIIKEEEYLRTMSYHGLSRYIDKTWYLTIKEYVYSSSRLQHALDNMTTRRDGSGKSDDDDDEIVQQNHEGDSSGDGDGDGSAAPAPAAANDEEEAAADVGNNTAAAAASNSILRPIQPSQIYNQLMLPIVELYGPYDSLDRYEYMKQLVSINKQQQQQQSSSQQQESSQSSQIDNDNDDERCSCIIWLHGLENLAVTYQEELVRQCLVQEELPRNTGGNADLSSLSSVLMEWAKQTQKFNNIVVFVETPTVTQQLQVFIEWLAERRAYDGIPFHLVWMVPPCSVGGATTSLTANGSQLGYAQTSSWGPLGSHIQTIVLPTPTQLLDNWWERVSSSLAPLLLLTSNSNSLSSLQQSFCESQGSAVRVIKQIKQLLAVQHTKTKGTFLITNSIMNSGGAGTTAVQQQQDDSATATASSFFLNEHQDRIRWFHLHKDARNMVCMRSKTKTELQNWQKDLARCARDDIDIALRVKRFLLKIQEDNKGNSNKQNQVPLLFRLLVGDAEEHTNTSTTLSTQKLAPTKLLPFLLQLRTDCSGAKRTFINKLIVVIGGLIGGVDTTSLQDLHTCLDDAFRKWNRLLHLSHYQQDDEHSTYESLATVQPRRQIVSALVYDDDDDEIEEADDSLSKNVAGQLYRLIVHDRISISRYDWFTLFREKSSLGSQLSLQEACRLFACGICSLKIAGLIRETRRRSSSTTSSNDCLYVKSVIVWCSGD